MAYTPINWQTGDTITAEKLNKMDNGWSVETTELFSETVTTADGEGQLSYVFQTEPPSKAMITFDGTSYTCLRDADYGYGDHFFVNYPFYLAPLPSATYLYVETSGSHVVTFDTVSVEVSDNFSDAVNAIVGTSTVPMLCESGITTYNEMLSAQGARRLLYFYAGSNMHIITYFLEEESATAVQAIPAGVEDVETYGFADIDGTLVFQVFFY